MRTAINARCLLEKMPARSVAIRFNVEREGKPVLYRDISFIVEVHFEQNNPSVLPQTK